MPLPPTEPREDLLFPAGEGLFGIIDCDDPTYPSCSSEAQEIMIGTKKRCLSTVDVHAPGGSGNGGNGARIDAAASGTRSTAMQWLQDEEAPVAPGQEEGALSSDDDSAEERMERPSALELPRMHPSRMVRAKKHNAKQRQQKLANLPSDLEKDEEAQPLQDERVGPLRS
jgi:hypothetical protein